MLSWMNNAASKSADTVLQKGDAVDAALAENTPFLAKIAELAATRVAGTQ